jgi:hypothetical protein
MDVKKELRALLARTLEEGPGPRKVSWTVADVLGDFILSEAGANAPAAIDEILQRIRARMQVAMGEEPRPDKLRWNRGS